jgi:hypothetical protein
MTDSTAPDPGEAASSGQPGDNRPANQSDGPPAGQPELLALTTALRRQARVTRQGYWFPLVLFAVLTCASVPFYIQPAPPTRAGAVSVPIAGPFLPYLGGYGNITVGNDLAYYWIAALVGGLLLSLVWYWWHARRVGLATRASGYLVTMGVLTVLAIVLPLLSQLHWLRPLGVLSPGDLVMRGTFPFLIIAASLLALAWAERSPGLTITAVVYTAAALLASLYNVSNIPFRFGWNIPPADGSLPNVLLPALVLIAGGAAALAVRRHRAVA